MSLYHIILIGVGSSGLFSGGVLFGTILATFSLKERLLIKLQNIVNNICDNVCPNDCVKRKEMIEQILTEISED